MILLRLSIAIQSQWRDRETTVGLARRVKQTRLPKDATQSRRNSALTHTPGPEDLPPKGTLRDSSVRCRCRHGNRPSGPDRVSDDRTHFWSGREVYGLNSRCEPRVPFYLDPVGRKLLQSHWSSIELGPGKGGVCSDGRHDGRTPV